MPIAAKQRRNFDSCAVLLFGKKGRRMSRLFSARAQRVQNITSCVPPFSVARAGGLCYNKTYLKNQTERG